MHPEHQKQIDKIIEEEIDRMKAVLRNGNELRAFYIIFVHDEETGKIEQFRKECNDYMENDKKKEILAHIIKSYIANMMDDGFDVIAVGLFSDAWWVETSEEKYKTEKWVEPRLNPERKETLMVMLAEREGVEQFRYPYKRIGGTILFEKRPQQDFIVMKGTFSKLFPEPRTAKNTHNIYAVDMTMYFTTDLSVLSSRQPPLGDYGAYRTELEKEIRVKKGQGFKTIGFILNQYAIENIFSYDESLFDEVFGIGIPIENTQQLARAIRTYIRMKHGWYANQIGICTTAETEKKLNQAS